MKAVAVLLLLALSANAGEVEGLKDFFEGVHYGYFKTPVSAGCFDDEAQTKFVHQASELVNDLFANSPLAQIKQEYVELLTILDAEDAECRFTETLSAIHQAMNGGLEVVLTRALFHSMELEIHGQNVMHTFARGDYLAAGKSLGNIFRVISG